jgi:hypothetical protein
MSEILELEKIESERNGQLDNPEKDTWIMKLPKEVYHREGLAEGTLVSLTVRNGGIQSSFIKPKPELAAISKRLKVKNKKLYEELKRIGD